MKRKDGQMIKKVVRKPLLHYLPGILLLIKTNLERNRSKIWTYYWAPLEMCEKQQGNGTTL